MLTSITSLLKKAGQKLAHPQVFFYSGIWMMFLLVIGTIAQQKIGLYQAQSRYFSSLFFWFYGLPLPAGRTLMGLMLLSLVIKILFFQEKKRLSMGSGIFHLGAIFLLAGGFITGLFSQENYMAIPEKEKSNILFDYHYVELAVLSPKKTLATFHEKELIPQTVFEKNLPFKIRVQKFMKNMEPVQRKESPDDSFQGFARIFKLKEKKREKVNEENLSGLTFQIFKDKTWQNYALFESMPRNQTVKWQDKKYILQLRPRRTFLPFFIELEDFKKTDYPGTRQARSYKSVVYIVEGATRQRQVIEMNQPLRHRGWTFYQSSFMEGKRDTTVLAVVKNKGRAFPYLSSIIICLGLLIHMTLNLKLFAPYRKGKVK